MITFGPVRSAALDMWLHATYRVRDSTSDNISGAYECRWQNGFQDADSERIEHYSVFCSMGEWNTNLTDWLMDDRFDHLSFESDDDKDLLFRHHTIFFLLISEMLTDFQDVLTVYRLGRFPVRGDRDQNDISRRMLDFPGLEGTIQNIFDYINNVFKHKTKNFHTCNHHLYIYFEDAGLSYESAGSITIHDATRIIRDFREGRTSETPNKVVIPNITFIIAVLANSYQVLDREFQANPEQFAAFCQIYQGENLRADPSQP